MSEVLAAERWREEKMPPCTAVSMHAGKLHHSVKYKHPSAQKMVDTNWRSGIDAPTYQTTSKEATRQVWNANLSIMMPRIDKNASADGMFSGYAPYNPKAHFASVNQTEHRSTVYDPAYQRAHPAAGFDRLTANRTNYALGKQPPVLEVTTSTSHTQFTTPGHAEQPNIGGWHTKTGQYFNDVDVREGMKRGSQGSGGILGYNFNVITGAPKGTGDPHRLPLRSRDPRISRNVTEKEALRLDAWGDVTEHRTDIVSGKFRPAVQGPPPFDPRSVRRPDVPVLRTRPW